MSADCETVGCGGTATKFPVLLLFPPRMPRAKPIRNALRRPTCDACAARIHAREFLTDKVWRGILKVASEAGVEPPDRSKTRVEFMPLEKLPTAGLMPVLQHFISDESEVQVKLYARDDETWFWRVRLFSIKSTGMLGRTIAFLDVDGRLADSPKKAIANAGRALAYHQNLKRGENHDPDEVAHLAVEAYEAVIVDLERRRKRKHVE